MLFGPIVARLEQRELLQPEERDILVSWVQCLASKLLFNSLPSVAVRGPGFIHQPMTTISSGVPVSYIILYDRHSSLSRPIPTTDDFYDRENVLSD